MAKHSNFRTGELLLICAVIIASVTAMDKRVTHKRKFDFMYYHDAFLNAEAMNSDSSINRCVIAGIGFICHFNTYFSVYN